MVPVASTPSMITRPAVGSSRPAMMLKIVLLPQPDGPIRLTKRPCGMARLTGASAWKTFAVVAPVLNVMLTSSTQSFGAGMHAPATKNSPHSAFHARLTPYVRKLYRKSYASDHSRFTPGNNGRLRFQAVAGRRQIIPNAQSFGNAHHARSRTFLSQAVRSACPFFPAPGTGGKGQIAARKK